MDAAKKKALSPAGLAVLWFMLLLVITLILPQTCVWGAEAPPQHASCEIAFASASAVGVIAPVLAYDASDCRVAADTAGQPLALGLQDAGLDAFAQARGATTATGENWQATVLQKLADPNTTVHFNLDQVDVWPGVTRAASGQGGPTDWELLQIQQNPQFWDTIQFWKDGAPVANPFK